jgi:hypothetical protein
MFLKIGGAIFEKNSISLFTKTGFDLLLDICYNSKIEKNTIYSTVVIPLFKFFRFLHQPAAVFYQKTEKPLKKDLNLP